MASGFRNNLSLQTQLGMRLSQQQLRYVGLLEMTAPELDEAVERELEDNPALKAEDRPADPAHEAVARPESFYQASGGGARQYEDYSSFTPDESDNSLYESLLRQISQMNLPEDVADAARYIVGSLDSNGYMSRTSAQLSDDMAFSEGMDVSESTVRQALEAVRSLEPYGVGASSLKDCLEIQLLHLPASDARDKALRIVQDDVMFRELSMHHSHKLQSRLRCSESSLKEAVALIRSLNPRPGASLGNSAADGGNIIVPDIIVDRVDGRLSVSLNNRIPELSIEESFAMAVRDMEHNRERRVDRRKVRGNEFVLSRYNDARDFMKILAQRQKTLLDVMTAIISLQKEYFDTEDVYTLRPMLIKDVSRLTGLDASVVSRCTNNKYVATPWGIFPLRFFFSDTVSEGQSAERGEDESEDSSGSGESPLTNRKIEAEIRRIIDNEDKRHPVSDEKIRLVMEEAGFDISRRTVAKYRDRIGIPVARLRKDI